MAAMMHGLVQGGPPTGPGGPFSLADHEHVAALVRGAGFDEVTVEGVESRTLLEPQRHLEVVGALAPPLAAALSAATPEQREAVAKTVGELTAQYREDGGVRLPSLMVGWVVRNFDPTPRLRLPITVPVVPISIEAGRLDVGSDPGPRCPTKESR